MRKLPRHAHPFTKEDLESIKASEQAWFEVGDCLYKAAMHLLPWTEVLEEGGSSLHVGRPVMRMVNDELVLAQRPAVPEMLFAMAVEAWLKGLIVMRYRREPGRATRVLEQLVEPDSELIEIIRATHDARFQRAAKRDTVKRSAENRTRVAALDQQKNRRHDLRDIAKSAGITPRSLKTRQYLDYLSRAVMFGRYPAPDNPGHVVVWEGVACDLTRWDEVRDLIHSKYEGLLSKKLARRFTASR